MKEKPKVLSKIQVSFLKTEANSQSAYLMPHHEKNYLLPVQKLKMLISYADHIADKHLPVC